MKKGDTFIEHFYLTDQVYKGFITIFRDENPLHTNIEFAKSKGFDSIVMHGNILNGFISYFIGECLPDKNVIIQTQKIIFSLPVYINEPLQFQAEITDVFESVRAVEFKYYFMNSLNKKVAKGNIQIGLLK